VTLLEPGSDLGGGPAVVLLRASSSRTSRSSSARRAVEALDLGLDPGQLRGHLAGPVGVVPQPGLGGELLELGEAVPLALEVEVGLELRDTATLGGEIVGVAVGHRRRSWKGVAQRDAVLPHRGSATRRCYPAPAGRLVPPRSPPGRHDGARRTLSPPRAPASRGYPGPDSGQTPGVFDVATGSSSPGRGGRALGARYPPEVGVVAHPTSRTPATSSTSPRSYRCAHHVPRPRGDRPRAATDLPGEHRGTPHRRRDAPSAPPPSPPAAAPRARPSGRVERRRTSNAGSPTSSPPRRADCPTGRPDVRPTSLASSLAPCPTRWLPMRGVEPAHVPRPAAPTTTSTRCRRSSCTSTSRDRSRPTRRRSWPRGTARTRPRSSRSSRLSPGWFQPGWRYPPASVTSTTSSTTFLATTGRSARPTTSRRSRPRSPGPRPPRGCATPRRPSPR
jgi:hypothetical protein